MSKSGLSYKMTLLGDSGVGKTSLFKKLFTGKFDPRIISTIGVDKRSLNISINTDEGEKDVDRSLFDTAGQERFRSISISYFRESSGFFVMYDITSDESFQNVQQWLNDIKNNLGNISKYLIILLGNKLDIALEDSTKREVKEKDAAEFCQNNDIFWGGECSVKDFSVDDLKEMFKKFVEELYKKVGANVKRSESILVPPDKKKKKKFKC